MAELPLPMRYKIVEATPTVTTDGTVTFDVVCLKNVNMAYIVAQFLMPQAHATTIQPVVGISAASCATAITFAAPAWRNATTGTTDTLTALTPATTAACSAVATNQILVIQIDPAEVTNQSNTYDWLGATIATSSQATDFVTAMYYLEMRYPPALSNTVIA